MKFFLVTLYIFISVSLFAQSWEKYISKDGINFFTLKQQCHDEKNNVHREYYFLKIENSTCDTLSVEWKPLTWYNGKCSACDSKSAEHIRKLILLPGEVAEGGCNDIRIKKLCIFSKFLNINDPTTVLEKLELSDIVIKKN
jgi:hypothetical protein